MKIRGLTETWVEALNLTYDMNPVLLTILDLIQLSLIAYMAYWIIHKVTTRISRAAVRRTKTQWDDILIEAGIIKQFSAMVPMVIFYVFSGSIFPDIEAVGVIVRRLSISGMVLFGVLAFSALLTVLEQGFRASRLAQRFSIRSYIQVVRLIMFFITFLLIISIVVDRSIWGFLSGLGAMTAIVMLVFKDTILGFVASVQMSINNTIKEGDWIEIPKYGADGNVVEIGLNMIKIQNWDKNFVIIPSHEVVAGGVKNWSGMAESGARRIKKSIHLDLRSICYCNDHFIKALSEHSRFKAFVEQGLKPEDQTGTNLRIFRLYLRHYLQNHPNIRQDMTLLVRDLKPNEYGLPLEIYIFSNIQEWASYEDISADIIEEACAALPFFQLKPYQLAVLNEN